MKGCQRAMSNIAIKKKPNLLRCSAAVRTHSCCALKAKRDINMQKIRLYYLFDFTFISSVNDTAKGNPEPLPDLYLSSFEISHWTFKNSSSVTGLTL